MTRTAFVVSTGRTGTLFLAEYFQNNYDHVIALHEPFPSYVTAWCANAYLAGALPKWALTASYHLERDHILRRITPQTRLYLDATWWLSSFLDVLDRLADDPVIFHVVRDPREFVRSAHNKGSHSGWKRLVNMTVPYTYPPVRRVSGSRRVSSVGKSAAKWVLINQYIADHAKRYPHYHLIKFEDIFGEGNTGLRCMCDVLNLPYLESGEVSPSEKLNPGRQKKMDRWQQWPAEHCRELHEITAPLMQEYGYGLESEWLEKTHPSR